MHPPALVWLPELHLKRFSADALSMRPTAKMAFLLYKHISVLASDPRAWLVWGACLTCISLLACYLPCFCQANSNLFILQRCCSWVKQGTTPAQNKRWRSGMNHWLWKSRFVDIHTLVACASGLSMWLTLPSVTALLKSKHAKLHAKLQ